MTRFSNRMLILLIIISTLIIVLVNHKKSDKVTTVFNYNDYNKTYIIYLDGYGITTKNIPDYFDNEVVAVYPKLSKKYTYLIDSGWYYIDKSISIENNYDYLNKYYKNIFYNNKLNNEVINIDLNGVGISKIKVVTDNINNYSNYKIEKVNFN